MIKNLSIFSFTFLVCMVLHVGSGMTSGPQPYLPESDSDSGSVSGYSTGSRLGSWTGSWSSVESGVEPSDGSNGGSIFGSSSEADIRFTGGYRQDLQGINYGLGSNPPGVSYVGRYYDPDDGIEDSFDDGADPAFSPGLFFSDFDPISPFPPPSSSDDGRRGPTPETLEEAIRSQLRNIEETMVTICAEMDALRAAHKDTLRRLNEVEEWVEKYQRFILLQGDQIIGNKYAVQELRAALFRTSEKLSLVMRFLAKMHPDKQQDLEVIFNVSGFSDPSS